jgi:uncharacterized protein (DUF433 family)
MALDWSRCAAVESVPGEVSGGWVFRGTRIPVVTVFENLEYGLPLEQVRTVLNVTAHSLEVPAPVR